MTKRANSVLPLGEPEDVDQAIDAAERFYAERGLPCVFSMGPGAPASLDERLEARGYRVVDRTTYLTASLDGPLAEDSEETAPARVGLYEEPSPEWLAAWWAVDGRYDGEGLPCATRILRGVPATYADVRQGGRALAVGRSVLQGDTLGIYCMATLPEARRRGLAGAVLRTLTADGRARGAVRAYLVVIASNAPAIALYTRHGFTPTGGYHYRVR
nr:GNAT family N-acetyltransferase [Sphaerisporangium album]